MNGEDGSTASTPTVRPSPRQCASSALVRVDLPTPGDPVIPASRARPVWGWSSATTRAQARRGPVLDAGQHPREGPAVSRQQPLHQLRSIHGRRGYGARPRVRTVADPATAAALLNATPPDASPTTV